MNELTEAFRQNPPFAAGCLIFMIGILIFAFGRKFLLFRWFFGDRSMFSQLFWGLILCLVGLGLIVVFQR